MCVALVPVQILSFFREKIAHAIACQNFSPSSVDVICLNVLQLGKDDLGVFRAQQTVLISFPLKLVLVRAQDDVLSHAGESSFVETKAKLFDWCAINAHVPCYDVTTYVQQPHQAAVDHHVRDETGQLHSRVRDRHLLKVNEAIFVKDAATLR